MCRVGTAHLPQPHANFKWATPILRNRKTARTPQTMIFREACYTSRVQTKLLPDITKEASRERWVAGAECPSVERDGYRTGAFCPSHPRRGASFSVAPAGSRFHPEVSKQAARSVTKRRSATRRHIFQVSPNEHLVTDKGSRPSHYQACSRRRVESFEATK